MQKGRWLGFLLLLSTVFFLAGTAHAADNYWVAFNGTGGVFKYIMQIDATGNITIQPKAVLDYDVVASLDSGEPDDPYGDPGGENADNDNAKGPHGPLDGPCAIALSDNGTSSINYYILTSQGSVFRYVLPKSTLTPPSRFPVAIRARAKETTTLDFRMMQATQHTTNRFLALNFGDIGVDQNGEGSPPQGFDNIQGRLTAFGLDSSGKMDGTTKRISPRTDGHNKTGGVSSDGLMAISNNEVSTFDDDRQFTLGLRRNDFEDRIYAQPLDNSRKPVGDPKVVGISGSLVGAEDVSNPLTGGVRYLVYTTRSADFPDSSNGDDVILQKIDAVTGDKVGGKHFLQQNIEMTTSFIQGIAIDPDGRFIIFIKRPVNSLPPCPDTSANEANCGSGPSGVQNNPDHVDALQVGNRDSLYYLAIDSNGNALGDPKLLFSADDGFQSGQIDENLDTNATPNACQECAIPQINGIDILKD